MCHVTQRTSAVLFCWSLCLDGRLQFKVEAEENDYLFDEIGSALKIKQYQAEKRELLESLELYYKVKVLGIPADELLDDEQMERYQED